MHPEFLPKTGDFNGQAAHLGEELAETAAAIFKTLRFGPESVNPLLPKEQQETNLAWVLRELADARGAMDRFEHAFALQERPGCVGTSIMTYTGNYFDFNAPFESVIDPEDIAFGLARTCRYGGHTKAFYSVAQHCVMVSRILPPELALVGLLHDASEAYTGDMVSPLKQILPEFRRIEDSIEAAIARRFSVPHPWPAEVKHADLVLLVTEKRDLMGAGTWPGLEAYEPLSEPIWPWAPDLAAAEWLANFYMLTAR
jgi:hypothetical protein